MPKPLKLKTTVHMDYNGSGDDVIDFPEPADLTTDSATGTEEPFDPPDEFFFFDDDVTEGSSNIDEVLHSFEKDSLLALLNMDSEYGVAHPDAPSVDDGIAETPVIYSDFDFAI